jgi:hypothetical protein
MLSVRRLAIGAILAIVIGAPIVETFDQWDQTAQDGNDTEINLVIVALCVGVAFSFTGALLAAVRATATAFCRCARAVESARSTLRLAAPSPNSRPPTPLRV